MNNVVQMHWFTQKVMQLKSSKRILLLYNTHYNRTKYRIGNRIRIKRSSTVIPVDKEIDQIKSRNFLPFVYSFYKASNYYLIAKSYLFNSVKETRGLYYNKIKPLVTTI